MLHLGGYSIINKMISRTNILSVAPGLQGSRKVFRYLCFLLQTVNCDISVAKTASSKMSLNLVRTNHVHFLLQVHFIYFCICSGPFSLISLICSVERQRNGGDSSQPIFGTNTMFLFIEAKHNFSL